MPKKKSELANKQLQRELLISAYEVVHSAYMSNMSDKTLQALDTALWKKMVMSLELEKARLENE